MVNSTTQHWCGTSVKTTSSAPADLRTIWSRSWSVCSDLVGVLPTQACFMEVCGLSTGRGWIPSLNRFRERKKNMLGSWRALLLWEGSKRICQETEDLVLAVLGPLVGSLYQSWDLVFHVRWRSKRLSRDGKRSAYMPPSFPPLRSPSHSPAIQRSW